MMNWLAKYILKETASSRLLALLEWGLPTALKVYKDVRWDMGRSRGEEKMPGF